MLGLPGYATLLVYSAVVKRLKQVQLGVLGGTRSLGDGVSEMRLHLGAGDIIFLLTGGPKREQSRNIARAKALAADIASTH